MRLDGTDARRLTKNGNKTGSDVWDGMLVGLGSMVEHDPGLAESADRQSSQTGRRAVTARNG
jgi:hypothetical protein